MGAAVAAPVHPLPAPDLPLPVPETPLRDLPIAAIAPNPFQPRRSFNPQDLTDLENSLRANGLLQPVTVRPTGPGTYQLIAGERRLRAASRLGWTSIPSIIKPLDDRDMLVLALVENLQRADLNAIDEALGLQRLIQDFSYTQQQVADAVGKDRSTVANLLRLLALPDGIQRMVRNEQLTLGHARALLALPNERAMLDAARQVVEHQLSVREVERLSQTSRPDPTRAPASTRSARGTPVRSPEQAEVRRLTELLRRKLQTDVRLDLENDGRGSLAMTFYSLDDLHRVIELILGPSFNDA